MLLNYLSGLRGSRIQKSIVFGIIIARYVALPLIGVCVVKGALLFGLVNSDDPLYHFILLLQFAMPPAMNIGIKTFQLYIKHIFVYFNDEFHKKLV